MRSTQKTRYLQPLTRTTAPSPPAGSVTGSITGIAPTTVATVLTPIERVRVDVAAQGAYATLHRGSIEEVVEDLRAQQAAAVLVSVSRYDPASTAYMAAMVREFPRVPTLALLTDVQRSTPQLVHALGRIGVRTLVDARQASGWMLLRELLHNERANDVQRVTLGVLDLDLAGAPPDCWRFFEILFTHRPHVANVRQMGRHMNVLPATLMSRFYRAQLPSPKRYIDLGRLVRAARVLENTGVSVTSVSRQLDYSSPQAFNRHVRGVMGMSAVEFRRKFDGEEMLSYFRAELITPYVDILRAFRPVDVAPAWLPKARRA